MRPTTHHLTEKQIAALAKLSKHDGLPVAELIRRAIDRYVESRKAVRL